MKILVINGPNLNMLGIREPAHYGRETYADLVEKIQTYCTTKGVEVSFFQSNHEGALVVSPTMRVLLWTKSKRHMGLWMESSSIPEPTLTPVLQFLTQLNQSASPL